MINQKFVLQDLNNSGHVKFSRGRRASFGKYGSVTDEQVKRFIARTCSKEERREINNKLMPLCKREHDNLVRKYQPLDSSRKKLTQIVIDLIKWYDKWEDIFPCSGSWEVREFLKKLEDFEGYWPDRKLEM